MKLILAIVQDKDAGRAIEALVKGGYGATRINTVGGFLRRGNATILSGVDDADTAQVLEILRSVCGQQPTEPGSPAASGVAFVLPVSASLKI